MKTVFILADSTNRRFLNCYGASSPAITPALDRLAERGLVFDQHWCGSAPCMPARRDLMTGRLGFLEKPWGGMEPFDQSLPYLLGKNNVHSHIVTDHYLYDQIGGENYMNQFTSFEMVRGQEFDNLYLYPDKNGQRHSSAPPNYKGIYSLARNINMGKVENENDYPSPITMDKAAKWLEANHDADNFFLWVEGFDPHEPFDVPQKYLDMYPEDEGHNYKGEPLYWPKYQENEFDETETQHLNLRYKALLTMTDEYIGHILNVLDKYEMWEDTMLVFTTDHGYMLGEQGYMAKNYMPPYNEVFHIPMIIAHPDAEPGRCTALTQNIDLFPTLLDYFDVSLNQLHYPLHGVSLLPILKGESNATREGIIYGYFGKTVAYTDSKFTYFAAAKEDNKPLYVYTAMPTTLKQYFGVDSIEVENYSKIQSGNFLNYTDYPVYKIPAEIIDYRNPSQWYHERTKYNTESLLFNIEDDYEQQHPIDDPELIHYYRQKTAETMRSIGSPAEQFERLEL